MKQETKKRRETKTTRKRKFTASLTDGGTVSAESVTETSQERAEALLVLREMSEAYLRQIEYYKKDYGGEHTHDEAVKLAESMMKWRREEIENKLPHQISWADISALGEVNIDDSFAYWVKLRETAADEFETGRQAGKVVGVDRQPYELAQFYAIRDGFADQWQPQGGIELAMIDMLAVAFSLQMYWSTVAHQRVIAFHNKQEKEINRYETNGWKSPYQSEADAVEQAHRLADSYNRQFLRVLRQLRDLRRYSAVIIQNNGGQVNVGNQQVNVQKLSEK